MIFLLLLLIAVVLYKTKFVLKNFKDIVSITLLSLIFICF